jgi:hypothetical protein
VTCCWSRPIRSPSANNSLRGQPLLRDPGGLCGGLSLGALLRHVAVLQVLPQLLVATLAPLCTPRVCSWLGAAPSCRALSGSVSLLRSGLNRSSPLARSSGPLARCAPCLALGPDLQRFWGPFPSGLTLRLMWAIVRAACVESLHAESLAALLKSCHAFHHGTFSKGYVFFKVYRFRVASHVIRKS